jgi:hypothetical protein
VLSAVLRIVTIASLYIPGLIDDHER